MEWNEKIHILKRKIRQRAISRYRISKKLPCFFYNVISYLNVFYFAIHLQMFKSQFSVGSRNTFLCSRKISEIIIGISSQAATENCINNVQPKDRAVNACLGFVPSACSLALRLFRAFLHNHTHYSFS